MYNADEDGCIMGYYAVQHGENWPTFQMCLLFYHQGDRFNFYETIRRNRDSSAGIMYGYGLDDRAIEVRSPAEEKGFLL
jgi:hypothetical protein